MRARGCHLKQLIVLGILRITVSFSAIYKRIVASCLRRVKNEREEDTSTKLALIAVANKLLKQAFAIAKSGLPYDENFVSVLSKG